MGWIVHHAIVITTHTRELADRAYTAAAAIFPTVTPPVPSALNNYWTLLIPPDGSKEGWPASAAGDAQRVALYAWLATQADAYGSSRYTACTLMYEEVDPPTVTHLNGIRIAPDPTSW